MIQKLLKIHIWTIKPKDDNYKIKYAQYLSCVLNSKKDNRFKLLNELNEESNSNTGIFVNDSEVKDIYIKNRSKDLKKWNIPILNLHESVINQNDKLFNEILEEILKDKKNFINNKGEKDDSNLWTNFELLALCKLAIKNNIKIVIRSEYIPKWLFETNYTITEMDF